MPSFVPKVDDGFWTLLWAVSFPFLVGASLFLLAAILGFILVLNTNPIGYGLPHEHVVEYLLEPSSRYSVFTRHPRRIDWWSNLLQMIGAAIFEFNSIAAVVPPLYENWPRYTIYLPSTVASVLFVVSSYLKFVESVHGWIAWKPRSLGFWEGIGNVLGSVCFLAASIAGFWSINHLLVELLGVYLGFFIGSIFFLIGSYAKVVDTLN